ncbi:site-specific integrase [Bacteroides fragilis]|nr:site-specific integrase [Bacteroides fragilis]
MNQANVKVSFYLKKSEADVDGNCPVMAKLNIGKYSEAAFSVKMKVPQSRWISGRASGKSVAAKEINNRLDEIRAMALSIYSEQSAVRDGVTAEEVKSILLGMASEQETLLNYFRQFISNFEKRVGVNRTEGSLRAYRNAYNHIESFLKWQYKLSDISFTALDRSFIDKYDLYLRTECHLAPGTVINLTVQLKTIVGEAIADGIITAYPFMGYEPIRPKAVQKYLTDVELQRLMTTPLHKQTLYLVRDMFLFSCFTGISYRDMCSLTKENLSLVEDGTWWIKSARQKTKIEFEIPLLDLPLQIIKKYSDTASDSRLLPMYCNSNMNLYLKEIARICNINRPLVFHAARHTYATEITLSHGVPLETVSKMLGHRQIETTRIYAKVTDNKIDSDTKTLNRKISEHFTVVI